MNTLSYHAAGLVAIITSHPDHDAPLRADFFGVPDPVSAQQEVHASIPIYEHESIPVPVHHDSWRLHPATRYLESEEHLDRFVKSAAAKKLDVVRTPAHEQSEYAVLDGIHHYQQLLGRSGARLDNDAITQRLEDVGGQFPYANLRHFLNEEFVELAQMSREFYEQEDPVRSWQVRELAQYATNPGLTRGLVIAGLSNDLGLDVDDGLKRIIDTEREYGVRARRVDSQSAIDDARIGVYNVQKALHERINEQYFPEL